MKKITKYERIRSDLKMFYMFYNIPIDVNKINIKFTRFTPGKKTSWVIWPMTILFFKDYDGSSVFHNCHEGWHIVQIHRLGLVKALFKYIRYSQEMETEASERASNFIRSLRNVGIP